jgi:L-threonylcarbamoyladenylate synthase
MATRLLDARLEEHVRTAAELLRAGELVAFPTETVYGLGARADCERAVLALRKVKRRPAEKHFTILLARPGDWQGYAPELSPAACTLVEAFWPGPLTLVVPGGGGKEVGLRCPDCEATRRMLELAQVPVVAPSANVSGEPPALSAVEVLRTLGGLIAAVLDGGAAPLGVPSTVVRAGSGGIEVLREGALSRAEIEAALGRAGGD